MKLKFLGVGGAFTMTNFHSNMLLESAGKRLLIDCGSDIRFSLKEANVSPESIDAVYISHLHGDHAGGMEWLGYSKYFAKPRIRPTLYAHPSVMSLLWAPLRSSMAMNQTKTTLDTYFATNAVQSFCVGDVEIQMVQTIHYYDGHELMPSFGLFLTDKRTTAKVFLTTDTQYCLSLYRPYFEQATFIFHDCETYDWKNDIIKSGVHAHYSELKTLPSAFKSKTWLYHYQDGELPPKDGFGGFVAKGQSFEL